MFSIMRHHPENQQYPPLCPPPPLLSFSTFQQDLAFHVQPLHAHASICTIAAAVKQQTTKMYISTALISLIPFLTSARAQTVSDELAKLPACSIQCLTSAVAAAGCGNSQYACWCGPGRSTITAQGTPCINEKCSAGDVQTVNDITNRICEIVKVAESSITAPGAEPTKLPNAELSSTTATFASVAATQTPNAGHRIHVEAAVVGAAVLVAAGL
ncbi:hypothetical protein B0O99DRAFT_740452 [Bisporella sp. PMI_857]|nr:hypothetical protein B0O99DRAFT_740452 [Bisporella sp. PMI_857]